MEGNRPRIAVLAMQGAFAEHVQVLRKLGVSAHEARLPRDLEDVDGVIIPGGESTAIGTLAQEYSLVRGLQELHAAGVPLWGTCAGMILLAKTVVPEETVPKSLGFIDITVRRNAYGRQVDSFEEDLSVPKLGEAPFHAVFIRAPVIQHVGKGVDVLASLSNGAPVAVQQGKVLATAFHPELTQDPRFHACFIGLVKDSKQT